MTEYFVTARSFAAPFFSDSSEAYVQAETAMDALADYVASYSHPMGLYAAEVWGNHKDYAGSKEPLARWFSPQAQAVWS